MASHAQSTEPELLDYSIIGRTNSTSPAQTYDRQAKMLTARNAQIHVWKSLIDVNLVVSLF